MAITVNAYDADINDLIEACIADLITNGIRADVMTDDPLVLMDIKTYCRAHFQSPADHDRLIAAYDAQKGHLQLSRAYRQDSGSCAGGM